MSNRYLLFKVLPGKGLLFVFILLSWWAGPGFGQTWQTRNYTELDGMANSMVYDVTQDADGKMWMATRSGISCYDGLSWKNYSTEKAFPNTTFIKIAVDRRGRIWALVEPLILNGLAIVYYDGKQWTRLDSVTLEVTGLEQISAFKLVEKEGEDMPVILVGHIHAGICRWEKGKWTRLTVKDGLLSNNVNGIALLEDKCYVATGSGLSVIKGDGTIAPGRKELKRFPVTELKGICVDRDKKIWVFGNKYLGYFQNNNDKTGYYDTGIVFSDAEWGVKLLPDQRGGFYIANSYEIFYYNYETRRMQRLGVLNGLVSQGANGLFMDFEENTWISCGRGASKIFSRQFSNYYMQHGLLEDEVTAVVEYEPGKFVLGHNKGVTFWDGNTFRRVPLAGKIGARFAVCRVMDIKVDSEKNTWLALSDSGLAKIDRQKKVTWYGKTDGMPGKIMSLWIDRLDRIWIGTYREIFIFRHKEGIVSPVNGIPADDNIRKIWGKGTSLRYLATDEAGVYVYDEKKKRWKNYRVPGKKRVNSVYFIMEDSKGRLLVGTRLGLFTAVENNGGRLKEFEPDRLQLERPVYFIVEDRKQRIWLGTDNGVVRWDGKRAVRLSIPDGLAGQETNRAAGIIDSTGKVWIGTNRGVSIHNDRFAVRYNQTPPPKLHLLSVRVKDREIPLEPPNRSIQLNYKDNTLVFRFRGISFMDEDAVRFRHKLEGFDKEWLKEHYPYKQEIRYTNLSSGTYRFHLKARNSAGVWSRTVTAPPIIIMQPFYKAWWFYLLLFLALVFLLYGIFYFYSAKRSAAQLEELVAERTGQLQVSEKRYRALFEESRDMVFSTTPDGKFEDMNPAGVALLGCDSKEEVLNIDIKSQLYRTTEDRDAFQKEIEQKGYVKDFEFEIRRKDNEKRTVLVTATAVSGEKKDTWAVRGVARDITEKKKLQQQLEQAQKMEAIGTLAGGIAHDFNNILSVITGYIELSLDDLPEGTQLRRNIDQVLIAAHRAKELVNRILTFSRRSARERKPLKVALIVQEALKLLRSSLPTTIEIRTDITADGGIVLADATQIQQVVMNLCTNAAHAMREKGGLLKVELHEVYLDEISTNDYDEPKHGIYLKLTVSDTGHGIEPDIMKR
ncbi:MAG: PAS domain S-box protein, partial [bacterium]|nr:PAS domain S-box protein [bacterium]